MAHEIHSHDHVVLHRQRAWHGLGTIVQDAPTPAQSLALAKLDWDVEQWPLYATNGESRIAIQTHQLNVRSDTKTVLGIVGKQYQPVQNLALAQFCEALAEQGDVVKVETAGSIRNGQKVWFLLKGESFSVRAEDEVTPYILVSNGHDGGTALRCTPTTIRVVCSNTLHMVIPRFDQEGGKVRCEQAAYVAHHLGDVKAKVEAAKQALQLYGRALDTNRECIAQLAARDVNSEAVKMFFLECYARDFGIVPANPKDSREARQREKALQSLNSYLYRFYREEKLAGATAWNCLNAYTGFLQHDRAIRRKDAAAKEETRLSAKLFGVDADRATSAYALALSM